MALLYTSSKKIQKRTSPEVKLLFAAQAPGLPFIVNSSFKNLPRLEGRAVVELEVAKANGSAAFVDVNEGRKKVRRATKGTVDACEARPRPSD